MSTSEPALPQGPSAAERPVRILIVDDNPEVREMMAFMVQRMGHAVETADTGKKALCHIRTQRVEIVLLDLTMPDMDGFAFCREVQRDAALQPLYIIITSARNTLEDKAQGFALGAADYLTKPFSVRDLRTRLQAGEQIVRQQQSSRTTGQA